MSEKKKLGGWGIWMVVAVVAAAVVLLTVSGGKRGSEEADVQDAVTEGRVLNVHVMDVVPGEARDMIEIPGYLEPFSDAMIAAEKGGRITEIPVEKGASVKAGQILLRLNDRFWKAQAQQAEVQARETRKEWERWETLKDSGAVSTSNLDAVRKARDLAAAALEQARAHMEQCVVLSPIDGIVADRFVDRGEYAVEGGVLMRVVDVGKLKLVLDVPERDAAAVEVGREVAFSVSGIDQPFGGVVRFVSPAAARASNSYRTEVEVDNSGGLLRAGMIASARLVRRVLDDAIVIPLAAVVNEKGEHVVFVVEASRAVRRTVHIDAIQGQEVLLLDGLSAGEQLVIAGQRSLQDGRKVKVVDL